MTTSSSADIATLRGRAFTLAKNKGCVGDAASELLRDVAGVDSLKTLDLAGWQRLVAQLGGTVLPASQLEKPVNVSDKQWNYIQVLKKELQYDDTAFIGFVKHTTGLSHPNFLDAGTARTLITGLIRAKNTRRG